ncbi:MAG: ABC transporter substrate-binding protein [Chloroflexi bacterium]|nr:ABC transporter substrate-binding protein [Chloroflexota bacterium]
MRSLVGAGAALGLAACQSPAPAAPAAAPTVPPKPTAPAAAPTTAPAAAPTSAPTTAPAAASAPATAATAPQSAAATAPTTAAAAIKRGGTLNWAEIADPISFDPHTRSNASASNLQRLIYESFTRMDPRTMNTQPALAASWQYTSPTELVFNLRTGVTFHNGQPFSAEDAKWNVDRMIDPATANPFASWYAAIVSTSVVDNNTLKLTLKSPDPVLPEKFSAMRVSGFAPAGSDPTSLASQPIGTGPFKLASWTQNDQAMLQRNGSYWDSSFPYLDGLVVKVVMDEDTRIAGLRAGQLDWGLVSADGAKRLQSTQTLKFISGPQAVFTVFKYNQRFKPFADTRVRQALDMAIDRNLVLNNALGGAGALTGPIPYGWADYGIPPDQLPFKLDMDGAKSLLAAAGFGNGFEVDCVTLPEGQSSNFYPTIATAADGWKQLGVQVNIQPMELAAWLDKNNRNDFDMIVSNRGFRGDPIDILMPAFHTGGVDNQGYTNPQVDAWLDQATSETDRTKRRDLYLQVQKQVMADAVWSFLWVPVETDAMQAYVQGYDHVAFDGFRDLMAATWLDKS